MKLSIKLVLFIIGIIGVVIGGWKIYTGAYFRQSPKLFNVKCHYMMYACGDCHPQWQIDSAFAVKNYLDFLVNKDFDVLYRGEKIEDRYLPDSCAICYDFYFTGVLKKTFSDKQKFVADTFRMDLRDVNCCK